MTDTGAGRPDRGRPRLVVAGAILAATLLVVVLLRQPGTAPLQLAGSTPPDNARLGAVPGRVTLEFSGTQGLALAHVVVEDARGVTVSRGDAETSGQRVSQPVDGGGDGLFQVGYHVVSSDGAESAGVLRFTVGTARTGPVPAAPDPAVGHVHVTKDPASLLLVLIDLALIVVLLIAVLGRRRRTVRR